MAWFLSYCFKTSSRGGDTLRLPQSLGLHSRLSFRAPLKILPTSMDKPNLFNIKSSHDFYSINFQAELKKKFLEEQLPASLSSLEKMLIQNNGVIVGTSVSTLIREMICIDMHKINDEISHNMPIAQCSISWRFNHSGFSQPHLYLVLKKVWRSSSQVNVQISDNSNKCQSVQKYIIFFPLVLSQILII